MKYKIKVHGKWVTRYRRATRTRTDTRYRDETRYRDGDIIQPETVIQTPLDGTMTLTLAAPPGTSMVLTDPVTGAQLAPPASTQTVQSICGYRAWKLTLFATSTGPFNLTVAEP